MLSYDSSRQPLPFRHQETKPILLSDTHSPFTSFNTAASTLRLACWARVSAQSPDYAHEPAPAGRNLSLILYLYRYIPTFPLGCMGLWRPRPLLSSNREGQMPPSIRGSPTPLELPCRFLLTLYVVSRQRAPAIGQIEHTTDSSAQPNLSLLRVPQWPVVGGGP